MGSVTGVPHTGHSLYIKVPDDYMLTFMCAHALVYSCGDQCPWPHLVAQQGLQGLAKA